MTREEAIKIIRENMHLSYDKGNIFEALETLIPELRESEDERIRKALIDLVNNYLFWDTYKLDKEQVLAYLEKQKEQKELPLMNGNADLYFDEWNQQKQNPTKRQCFEEGMRYAQRLQKEQKSTPDWMPKFLDELRVKKHYFDWDEHRDIEGDILAIINWIAPDYFDRKEKGRRPDVKDPFSNANFVRGYESGYADAKRELKPAEWSAEDEKIIKTLLDYYEKALDNYTCVEWLNGITYGELCDFLKSLRPSWKPSEEEPEYYQHFDPDC